MLTEIQNKVIFLYGGPTVTGTEVGLEGYTNTHHQHSRSNPNRDSVEQLAERHDYQTSSENSSLARISHNLKSQLLIFSYKVSNLIIYYNTDCLKK